MDDGYDGSGPGRECWQCGYTTFNDEIDDDTRPGYCPQCGTKLAEREEPNA